jgi:hypothetical protein
MTIQGRFMLFYEVQFQCGCTVNADLHSELPYKKTIDDYILISPCHYFPRLSTLDVFFQHIAQPLSHGDQLSRLVTMKTTFI